MSVNNLSASGMCLVLCFWYILISCQKLVELLFLPTCIQMLWHKMTYRKSRRDGTNVPARAPLEPASWAFHWEGQVEVLLWWLFPCFSLLAFTQHWIRIAKGAVIANLRVLLLTSVASVTEGLQMSLWGHREMQSWKRNLRGKLLESHHLYCSSSGEGRPSSFPLLSGKRQPCWKSDNQAK